MLINVELTSIAFTPKTPDNLSLMHNPAMLINYSAALKSVYHSLTKYPPHFFFIKGMCRIKPGGVSAPRSIMPEIHMMPCPPARMIFAVPWSDMKPPPKKIRPIHNYGGRRAVN